MAIKVSTLLSHNTDLVLDTTPSLGGPLSTNNYPIINGSNPVVITGNNYPITTGLPGQFLSTNGAGILSFSYAALPDTTVVPGPYGSSSTIPTYTVNSKGQLTAASSVSISISPTQAGLGSVVNQLQVINAGGAPSMREGTGVPSGSDTVGAIYIDQSITNGNSIYRYNGSSWTPLSKNANLYNERTASSFIAPVAQANNSIALGEGAVTAPAAIDSLAIGLQSFARIQGGVVQASGRFSNTGDAQSGKYLVRCTTISAAPQELLVDGTGGIVRLTLPDNATWTFRITVTGHRTDAGDGHAGYTAAGVIYRGAGAATTAFQGSVQKVVLAESNPAWDINISADGTHGALRVTVTGENSKTIRWVALVETVEITN